VRASRTARVAGAFVCAAALAGCGHAAPPAPDARRAGATSAPEKSDPMEHPSGLSSSAAASCSSGTWEYEIPGDRELLGQKVARVGYLSAAIDDAVFTLAVPLSPGQDVNFAVGKAASAMQTIKRLPRPLDLVDVSEEVKRNPGRWPDCDR